MQRIKSAVIGMGNSGWFYHAEGTLCRSDTFELYAVCDADAERVSSAESHFGVKGYRSADELLKDPQVELVVLCLPHHLHYSLAIQAIESRKHVIVEKPMCLNVAEADNMIAAAHKHGVLLSVFHNRRWDGDFKIIRDLARAGKLGELVSVEIRRSNNGLYRQASATAPHIGDELVDWAFDTERGGGLLNLVSPHLIDQALLLAGSDPLSVFGYMNKSDVSATERFVRLDIRYAENPLISIEVSRQTGIPAPHWYVQGTEGTVMSNQRGTELHVSYASGEEEYYKDIKLVRHCDEYYENIYQVLRHGDDLIVKPEEASMAVAVIDACRRSAELGRSVDLSEVVQESRDGVA